MKKLLSWLLVLTLCLSLFPATALAEGPEENVILSEGSDLDGDSSSPAAPQNDSARDDTSSGADAPPSPQGEGNDDPADDPVGDDGPGVPSDEETTPPSPTQAPETPPLSGEDIPAPSDPEDNADPDALPPEGDEPEDVVASGDCGDSLIWTLNGEGVLTIAGSGDMWDWGWDGGPWSEHNSEITSVKILSGVTGIGSGAFQGCGSLTGVTIPEGVTSIGNSAFYECSSLTSVTIPEGVTSIGNAAFQYCSALTSVTIPESVTSIGNAAFGSCSSLTSVTIPEGVTSIGGYAFSGCSSLTDIYFGGTKAAWKQFGVKYDHYSTTVHCIDGDIDLADPMFCGDDLIWTLSSDGTLTIAGSGDMWDWDDKSTPWYDHRNEITSVRLLSGVTSIGSSAFQGCGSLTGVTIPEGVTSIGDFAFDGCGSLTGVTIPESVTSIGVFAFYECSSLASVTIPASVTSIGDSAFWGCSSLTSVTIPASVTSIGDWAFQHCSSLTSVTIPFGVTRIGRGAFCGCSALTSVEIPEGVTSIGDYAFNGCSVLTSCTIPEGVTSIGEAFQSCTGLTEIRFEGSAPTIGGYCFYETTATAYYPAGDATWTEDVRQNYGGTITWVGYGPIAGGQCGDNLTWTLDEDGVLTISGTGDMWDWVKTEYAWPSTPWNAMLSQISSLIIEPGVTGIGNWAFWGCRSLSDITLPDTVTRIGDGAFSECNSLLSLTVPEGVTSIGEEAFWDCFRLTTITLPASLTRVGDRLLRYCSGLTDIYFPATMAEWKSLGVTCDPYKVTVHCTDGDIAPADPMYCGDGLIWTLNSEGVLTIAGSGNMWDFRRNGAPWSSRSSEIKTVRLLSGVTGIGDFAFFLCENLTSVTIPEGVTSIGDEAFGYCQSLYVLTLPETVTSIGEGAFFHTSICSFVIPEGVTRIEENTFRDSAVLTNVIIPESVTVIGESAFCYCTSLTEITIPERVEQIDYAAFYRCNSLTEIRFEGSAPNSGDYVFSAVTATAYYPANDPSWTEEVRQNYGGTITWVGYGPIASGQCGDDLTWTLDEDGVLTISGTGDMWDWEQIESGWPNTPWQEHTFSVTAVVIEPGATGVGNWAFYGFENCADISLPDTLKRIGEGAFSCCSSLTELTIPEGVTDIGGYAFSYCMFLASISLPASLTATGLLPFDNCPDLTDIYFGGPREAWQQLGMDYDYYTVTVHCSDGDLALADPSRCGDDLTWSLADGVLSITGTGDMWDFSCAKAPWYWQRGEFRQVQIGDGATSIGANAFHYCDIVTQVTIPESVTAIGANAFTCCTDLNEISIPESVRFISAGAFSSCCLRRVTLPEALERIDAGAFAFSSCITEIRFTGPAPVLDSGCHQGGFLFSSVTATAYYPAGDETWTEAVMQDYGGSITWVSYELPGIPVNAAHFPDPIFRAYVSEHFDADGDGYLSDEEIALAKAIDLEESGVASLEGIQYFTELTELNASGGFMTAGALTQVDLSANTKLKSLYLGFNPLEGLDVSMLPELESLMVGFCGLNELDLSGNPALKELWCDDNNLTELDLSANPLLTHLDCCGNTGLLELDITPCPSLVADYQAGGRHISWMQEGMPEQYESIWVYGGTNDDDYNLAVNDYTTIIAPPAYTPGDINGDGVVNNKDVTRLVRYLKDPTMAVNAAALDVNGDGKVTNKDVTRLVRYLKHHDVEIF